MPISHVRIPRFFHDPRPLPPRPQQDPFAAYEPAQGSDPHQPLVDTYDIWFSWMDGRPMETGHQDYETVRRRARQLSAQWMHSLIFVYYGGTYRGRLPRPLAAFCVGVQLPCPIHLTGYEPAAYWKYPTDPETRYDLPAIR